MYKLGDNGYVDLSKIEFISNLSHMDEYFKYQVNGVLHTYRSNKQYGSAKKVYDKLFVDLDRFYLEKQTGVRAWIDVEK